MRGATKSILATTSVGLLLAGCSASGSQSASGGSQGSDYPIGIVLDQTGVSSQLSGPVGAGVRAYIQHLNDSGGINGHKIKIAKSADSQSTVAGAQGAFQDVMQSEPLAVIGSVSTLGISGVVPTMQNANTPVMLAFAPDPLLLPPSPWLFTQDMPAASELSASLSYLDKALGGLNGKRLAVSSAASSFGDAYVDAFQKQSKNLGYDVALVDRSAVTMTSFATNAAKIVDSKADALLLLDVPSQTSLIMKDLAAAGFTKPVVGYESASDPAILQAVGSEQYVSFRGAPVPAASGLLAQAASAAGVKDQLGSEWFSYGWNEAAVLGHALSSCKDPCTGPTLMKAIEATRNFTPPGDSTFGAVSYSATKHYAATSVQFYGWDATKKAEKPLLSPLPIQ
jgi:branched-chain amino acid transport system substrate-binding protein